MTLPPDTSADFSDSELFDVSSDFDEDGSDGTYPTSTLASSPPPCLSDSELSDVAFAFGKDGNDLAITSASSSSPITTSVFYALDKNGNGPPRPVKNGPRRVDVLVCDDSQLARALPSGHRIHPLRRLQVIQARGSPLEGLSELALEFLAMQRDRLAPGDQRTRIRNFWDCKVCRRSIHNVQSKPLCTLECIKTFCERHNLDDVYPRLVHIRDTGDSSLGYAVFASGSPDAKTPAIKKGTCLGFYLGEVKPSEKNNTGLFAFALKDECVDKTRRRVEDNGSLKCLVDAEHACNWTRFINSHCDPNVEALAECFHDIRMVALYAIRDIKGGEQVCINYGRGYFEGRPDGMKCCCSARAGPHLPVDDDDRHEGESGKSDKCYKTGGLRRSPRCSAGKCEMEVEYAD